MTELHHPRGIKSADIDDVARLKAQNAELLEERQRLLDQLFEQPALSLENDKLRAEIATLRNFATAIKNGANLMLAKWDE